jgi:hypothetical protein
LVERVPASLLQPIEQAPFVLGQKDDRVLKLETLEVPVVVQAVRRHREALEQAETPLRQPSNPLSPQDQDRGCPLPEPAGLELRSEQLGELRPCSISIALPDLERATFVGELERRRLSELLAVARVEAAHVRPLATRCRLGDRFEDRLDGLSNLALLPVAGGEEMPFDPRAQ